MNGTPIADEEIAELVKMVKPVVEKLDETDLGEATEFEIITVMAICYFGKVNFCDVVLFETGLGGRFDSTNVIHPVLTIITNIGHDHMHILGNTLGEIAYEKAGIIKSGVPVITGVQDEEALQVIQKLQRKIVQTYMRWVTILQRYINSLVKMENSLISLVLSPLLKMCGSQ